MTAQNNPEKEIQIVYTNYKGKTSIRTIIPNKIFFGSTEWHPTEQWLLNAHDIEKDATRDFALKDIRAWL